jgi:hypothetical protein
MNTAKHAEYMDRAFNAGAMPAPYMVRREIDRMDTILAQQTGRLYTSEQMAQQHTCGVKEGWRQARGMIARHGAVLVAFGVCVGITLAVIVGPMLAFMGAGA